MFPHARFAALALASVALVKAQDPVAPPAAIATFPTTPLAEKHFPYPSGIPYQADTENLIRGRQTGYNQCNSTTENQDSLCQTAFVNAVDDFCLWAGNKPDSVVGDTEGESVAWCTKPGHGTRLIPEGAIKGVQFIRTPDYLQVVGFIDQTRINIKAGDWGGELDPHGADLRGNPLGGLMYSNGWSNGNSDSYVQVIEWHNFMGGDQFCMKVCDPSKPNAARYCEHILDRIGCAFNAPHDAQPNVFEYCQGDNQDFPGIYVENGVTMTYTQPPESLGPITTMPYTARVPAKSQCVTYESANLFAAIATVSLPAPSGTWAPTGSASGSAAAATGTGSAAKGASNASRSGTGTGTTANAESTSNDASVVAISSFVSIMGVVFSALFLS
ncbi:hypothetical protein PC9H_002416 [Pleurotus ostreatus]|uniref:Uncharacterized protein n=1 Tax=Pleurotus ostreatus TaxID=5322 RepID=A0A8H6ZLJ6_PLEOS|nr:uncharacterized protein PC9H_002416 [Pleurotus ostreatus]KAF7416153.1 hypothetical protein PC9H_002416 [Pleurotus ostreatus]KAJ8688983.1 hypothetical protein PTI98_013053 [Pleurotus ostreatus]